MLRVPLLRERDLAVAPISSELANLIRQAEQLTAVGKLAEATEVVKRAYAQDKTNPDILVLIQIH